MQVYYVNNKKVSEIDFITEVERENYSNCAEHYEDFLNEDREEICLGGGYYKYGTVLRKVDPIAFKLLLDDFADSRYKDIMRDLQRGDIYEINDISFQIKDEESDELFEDLLREQQEQM